MTILTTRPDTSPASETTSDLREPTAAVRYRAVNVWIPWSERAAGAAAGTWLAAAVVVANDPGNAPLAGATGIAMTLLFAFTLAGRELRNKQPNRYEPTV